MKQEVRQLIDTKKEVVAALRTSGLQVLYENFVNSKTAIPCITYSEYDNSSYKEGNTLGYSTIIYHIKVWGKDLATISEHSASVDTIMRGLGFTRISMNELWLDGIGQRQMKFEAKAQEYFN